MLPMILGCFTFLLRFVSNKLIFYHERKKMLVLINIKIFCLQVIANSISLLNPSDVIKLLQCLLSIIHSR